MKKEIVEAFDRKLNKTQYFHLKLSPSIQHTAEKPFVCTECPKSFSHRESLVTHSSVHTGIRPYACLNCEHRFSCIGNLIKHRKTRKDTCGLPQFCKNVKVAPRPNTKIPGTLLMHPLRKEDQGWSRGSRSGGDGEQEEGRPERPKSAKRRQKAKSYQTRAAAHVEQHEEAEAGTEEQYQKMDEVEEEEVEQEQEQEEQVMGGVIEEEPVTPLDEYMVLEYAGPGVAQQRSQGLIMTVNEGGVHQEQVEQVVVMDHNGGIIAENYIIEINQEAAEIHQMEAHEQEEDQHQQQEDQMEVVAHEQEVMMTEEEALLHEEELAKGKRRKRRVVDMVGFMQVSEGWMMMDDGVESGGWFWF